MQDRLLGMLPYITRSSPGLDLAASIGHYWVTRGTTESVRWLDQQLASGEASPQTQVRAYYLLDAPRAPAPAGYQILSFEQQKACPHQQNLVGIFGVKLVVFGDCGSYDIGTQTLPLGCNWFTSPPRPGSVGVMLDIQLVGPVIQLVAAVLLFLMLLRRRPARGRIDLFAFAAAVIGSVVLLFGAAEQLWYLAPPGIAVLGIGWLAARRMMPGRRLAGLTVVLGLASLLEAVDNGIVLLPLTVGAVWLRLILEVVWIVWTGLALIAGGRAIRVAAVN